MSNPSQQTIIKTNSNSNLSLQQCYMYEDDTKRDGSDEELVVVVAERLALIQKQILDPDVLSKFSSSNAQEGVLLSGIPWRIIYTKEEAEEEGEESGSIKEDNGTVATTTTTTKNQIFLTESTSCYLDLRRKQNIAWAEERLTEGIALANKHSKKRQWKAAEECYKQGLEVVPDHAPLHVAYGALMANQGQMDKAIQLLDKALGIDLECPNAKEYKEAIMMLVGQSKGGTGTVTGKRTSKERENKNNKNVGGRNTDEEDATDETKKLPKQISAAAERSQKAMHNASLEQAFISGTTLVPSKQRDSSIASATSTMAEYPLVFQEDNNDGDEYLASFHSKKRKRSKRKKHRKKRSYRANENEGDEDTEYNSTSDDQSSRRKRKKHKKSRKKKKKHKN